MTSYVENETEITFPFAEKEILDLLFVKFFYLICPIGHKFTPPKYF